jgi:hypothetical protein
MISTQNQHKHWLVIVIGYLREADSLSPYGCRYFDNSCDPSFAVALAEVVRTTDTLCLQIELVSTFVSHASLGAE